MEAAGQRGDLGEHTTRSTLAPGRLHVSHGSTPDLHAMRCDWSPGLSLMSRILEWSAAPVLRDRDLNPYWCPSEVARHPGLETLRHPGRGVVSISHIALDH